MEGCSKYCSFCVVPYTRGEEASRRVDDVLTEIADLADQGVREVTLLGQNVNAYRGQVGGSSADAAGAGTVDFALLLELVSEIPGIERIRYTTSHPREFTGRLIEAHARLPKLALHVHLPVQSGSDRVLAAMKRGYTVLEYKAIVRRLRAAQPALLLASDFIVGFPGETEEDFAATLELAREVTFASTFFFKYSSRPGTPGADLADQVAEEVKSERLARLQDVVEAQRRAFNGALVGKTIEVLFEKPGRHPGQIAGKSPYLQPVQVDGPENLIGRVAAVEIVECSTNSLFGRLPKSAFQAEPTGEAN
jgi:tRNA-2-methylthio-N6-dimethylallyladenosine synthase